MTKEISIYCRSYQNSNIQIHFITECHKDLKQVVGMSVRLHYNGIMIIIKL